MKAFPMEPGRVVVSKAGRDAGKFFVILSVLDDGYVRIADGRLRKIATPKKKKTMHLRAKCECAPDIASNYSVGRLLDADIRKYLDRIGEDRATRKEEDAFG
ncbi:MAG: KOW domain-containing RNA-binding protein [Oscillospiraceae bacterium]|jgi:hypothetical protein|nr:KOW domain-containing RNA-binding protein [Oscillospiraceae bacterium]